MSTIVFFTGRQERIPLRCIPYRERQSIKTVLCWWFCQRVICIENQHVRIRFCYLSGQPQGRNSKNSALSMIGWVHIGVRARCLTFNWYGLAISLAGGILLLQMISTCLHGAYRKRWGGGRHPVKNAHLWYGECRRCRQWCGPLSSVEPPCSSSSSQWEQGGLQSRKFFLKLFATLLFVVFC